MNRSLTSDLLSNIKHSSCLLSKDASAGALSINHLDAKMYTLAVVDAEGHEQPMLYWLIFCFSVI